MKKFLSIAVVTALLNLSNTSSALAATMSEVITSKPAVDVVFVLDTTGSMGGLIAAAKQKIWSIANTLIQAKPAPDLRIGLVAYRDRGDAYITKLSPLTTNLDSMYETLMGFDANGGGDGPESVNQALNEAIHKFEWRKDDKTYKAVFLVGDAPPHMDYQDDVKYEESVRLATQQGIIVNTIQCGSDGGTTPIWQAIALKGEGKFFQVAQEGGAIVMSTPYDEKLALLSRDLDATRIVYGTALEQEQHKKLYDLSDKIAASAPIAARASRSELSAKKDAATNWLGSKELVQDVAEGKVKIEAMDSEELPAELKKMSKEERLAHVNEMKQTREKLQSEINTLSKQRQEYLTSEAKKAGKVEGSLDHEIFGALKAQGIKKGITLEGGPAL